MENVEIIVSVGFEPLEVVHREPLPLSMRGDEPELVWDRGGFRQMTEDEKRFGQIVAID